MIVKVLQNRSLVAVLVSNLTSANSHMVAFQARFLLNLSPLHGHETIDFMYREIAIDIRE
jgi:hypothetical protein